MQEYERAVIFRLGRLLSGGSRGPGKYFDIYLYSFLKPLSSPLKCSIGKLGGRNLLDRKGVSRGLQNNILIFHDPMWLSAKIHPSPSGTAFWPPCQILDIGLMTLLFLQRCQKSLTFQKQSFHCFMKLFVFSQFLQFAPKNQGLFEMFYTPNDTPPTSNLNISWPPPLWKKRACLPKGVADGTVKITCTIIAKYLSFIGGTIKFSLKK